MSRNRHTSELKARAAIEALKGLKPIHSLASEFGVYPAQVSLWKKQAVDLIIEGFKDRRKPNTGEDQSLKEELYKQIGQMKVEIDWLKKKSELLHRK